MSASDPERAERAERSSGRRSVAEVLREGVGPALRKSWPCLLPLLVLIATGLRGLDFGHHWDESPVQVAAVRNMVETGTLLPGLYVYPSLVPYLGLVAAVPVFLDQLEAGTEGFAERVLPALDEDAYRLRWRLFCLLGSSLVVVWVYGLVLGWRRSRLEALLAASLVASSWELAYHARWVAPDALVAQFGALTLMCAVFALRARDAARVQLWLRLAAIAAGLACGTKYPAGLFLPVVLVTGFLLWDRATGLPALLKRLTGLGAIFAATFVITTPGAVLQPTKFVLWLRIEMYGYSSGSFGGYGAAAGLEHFWRNLSYLGGSALSPYLGFALLGAALSLVGVYSVVRRERKEALVLLLYPLLYVPYFSAQDVMIVRNLQVIIPIMAVFAARGVVVLWQRFPQGFARVPLVIALVAMLASNAAWLVYTAETIADRKTDRFLQEAAAYIRERPDTKFYATRNARRQLKKYLRASAPTDYSLDEADVALLYTREGCNRHYWPANRRNFALTWFGPYEVNLSRYPSWAGDDRIIAMTPAMAREIEAQCRKQRAGANG